MGFVEERGRMDSKASKSRVEVTQVNADGSVDVRCSECWGELQKKEQSDGSCPSCTRPLELAESTDDRNCGITCSRCGDCLCKCDRKENPVQEEE